ncbi:MAG: RNA polymerase II holoenzyme cyclin-like subunit [Claussenomyces sp. TS43310]|nr:MAG: RNA polymerase II holoenzyme cyclin-like subunit [Claussenomyces sp. TS43310]
MAANYWESTQRRYWQFTKIELAESRQKLEDEDRNLIQAYPLPQLRHLSIYFNQQILRLGKRLQVRQQAMSTAQLYIRRFYLKVEIRRVNPYLIIATAVYLACKMEECPQHIRLVVSEARSLWPDFFNTDTSRLGECEFFLISEMNSQMIVHQPYRSLSALQSTFSLALEESSLAWSIINDHYMTDLPLLYAPHIVALTAILLALVLRPAGGGGTPSTTGNSSANIAAAAQTALTSAGQPRPNMTTEKNNASPRTKVQKFSGWLAESNVDIEGIVDCTQELISFYDIQEQYNEKLTREQIHRFLKARGLDK